MSKFFDYLTDIDLSIKFYKKLVLFSVSTAIGVPLVMFFLFTNSIKEKEQTIFIMDKAGNVFSAQASLVKENRYLEAVAHAQLFVNTFFEVDRFTCDRNLAQAYDLGGSCIHALYTKMESDSWFSKIKQYNVRQSVLIDNAECVSTEAPFLVGVHFRVQIISEASPEPAYTDIELVLTIAETNGIRTETNPHALTIENIEIPSFKQLN